MEKVIQSLEENGQGHLVKFYEELSDEEKIELLNDIETVDFSSLNSIFKSKVTEHVDSAGHAKPIMKIDDNLLKPVPCIEGIVRSSPNALDQYRSIGFSNICQGKVAALLLAGGQGTRLGVEYPKGMYEIGDKSLFELQANRIKTLQLQCNQPGAIINWYIMTSGPTMKETKEYFEQNDNFGLQVHLFEQNTIPCLDFCGKVFLDEKHKISRSPNGNGGIFEVLHQQGIIEDMKTRGIEFVHIYAVDNVLVRVCDPLFMGYCISKDCDAGAKVVEKTQPEEPVGTICIVDGRYKVIEYSEIPQDIAQRLDESSGKLLYSAANICDQFFSVKFLDSIRDRQNLPYHVAIKKIPHICLETGQRVKPESPNGVKLEKFIFDAFELTDKFGVWEVKREDEFSPIKNGLGSQKDNPETALKSLLRAYELKILEI